MPLRLILDGSLTAAPLDSARMAAGGAILPPLPEPAIFHVIGWYGSNPAFDRRFELFLESIERADRGHVRNLASRRSRRTAGRGPAGRSSRSQRDARSVGDPKPSRSSGTCSTGLDRADPGDWLLYSNSDLGFAPDAYARLPRTRGSAVEYMRRDVEGDPRNPRGAVREPRRPLRDRPRRLRAPGGPLRRAAGRPSRLRHRRAALGHRVVGDPPQPRPGRGATRSASSIPGTRRRGTSPTRRPAATTTSSSSWPGSSTAPCRHTRSRRGRIAPTPRWWWRASGSDGVRAAANVGGTAPAAADRISTPTSTSSSCSWARRSRGSRRTCWPRSRHVVVAGRRRLPGPVPEGGAAERRLAHRARGGRLRGISSSSTPTSTRPTSTGWSRIRARLRDDPSRAVQGFRLVSDPVDERFERCLARRGPRARPAVPRSPRTPASPGACIAACSRMDGFNPLCIECGGDSAFVGRVPQHAGRRVRPVAARHPLVQEIQRDLPCAPRSTMCRSTSSTSTHGPVAGPQLPGGPLRDRRLPAGRSSSWSSGRMGCCAGATRSARSGSCSERRSEMRARTRGRSALLPPTRYTRLQRRRRSSGPEPRESPSSVGATGAAALPPLTPPEQLESPERLAMFDPLEVAPAASGRSRGADNVEGLEAGNLRSACCPTASGPTCHLRRVSAPRTRWSSRSPCCRPGGDADLQRASASLELTVLADGGEAPEVLGLADLPHTRRDRMSGVGAHCDCQDEWAPGRGAARGVLARPHRRLVGETGFRSRPDAAGRRGRPRLRAARALAGRRGGRHRAGRTSARRARSR